MGWIVKLGGDKTVDFDDLPPATFDALAREEEDVSWYAVYTIPGASSARLYRVIEACAEHAGVDPPDPPDTMRDARALLDMLEMGTNVDELPVIEGFPPTPAVPGNGSTSGALGDSPGLEPSPALNPSDSS